MNLRLEGDAELVRRNLEERIAAQEALPFGEAQILSNVELEDGVAKRVPHGLGRKPRCVIPTLPRATGGIGSPGAIEEVQQGASDRSSALTVKATGYGVTITVDLVVL